DGIRDFHVTGVQTCALPIFATISNNADFWLDHDISSLSIEDLNKLSSLEGSELIRCNSMDIYKTHKEFKRLFKNSKNLKVIFPRSEERRVGKECISLWRTNQ